METKDSPVTAVILLSVFAPKAFEVLPSPHHVKSYPSDHITMTGHVPKDWVWRRSK